MQSGVRSKEEDQWKTRDERSRKKDWGGAQRVRGTREDQGQPEKGGGRKGRGGLAQLML